ncbi:MAG: dynamin [Okeania sp. SIO3I5]|uniref:dynamin family protein n=1 Tax=Okeania sp. SIO3I5 TaxID=2607805 RepID=UPI0013BCA9A5|nr:dynamin family protein [Okeania sp. SIO3I5]NEQ40983.1 dynamin [Okeania sp. SIO3I5]
MQQKENYQNLINYFNSALGILELEPDSQLRKDVISISEYLANPTFKIAVFAPFNYGKSTLLNALLGERTLPIDLIPTTGAAIYVKYGKELETRIQLKDGSIINANGTDILKEYAVLDDNRQMRDDVTSVEVYCPNSFLARGVEFLDLPGTNDREAQNILVQEKLLTADLVVQVLDARNLMTLGERENLRDWLGERGIKTVVFVVNFMNLLTPEEQKEVSNRMRFVAESFRSELPDNISNLYRVDALPALRGRLKGDVSVAQTTGLATFESALQSIVEISGEKTNIQLSRVRAIASQLSQVIKVNAQEVTKELIAIQEQKSEKFQIQKRAEKLIKEGFKRSSSNFQSWLYLTNLLAKYQFELAVVLEQRTFNIWESEKFRPEALKYKQEISEWVDKAAEFFQLGETEELIITFPEAPKVFLPPPPPSETQKSGGLRNIAIASGIGWLLGGPMGAAVVGGATYFLSDNKQNKSENLASYKEQVKQAYANAARDYLSRFSTVTFKAIEEYEAIAEKVIKVPVSQQSPEVIKLRSKLQLLNNLSAEINQELEFLLA